MRIELKRGLSGGYYDIDTPQPRQQRDQRFLDFQHDPTDAPPRQLRVTDELKRVADSLLEVQEQSLPLHPGTAPERLRIRSPLEFLSEPAPLVLCPAAREVDITEPGQ